MGHRCISSETSRLDPFVIIAIFLTRQRWLSALGGYNSLTMICQSYLTDVVLLPPPSKKNLAVRRCLRPFFRDQVFEASKDRELDQRLPPE